MVIAEMLQNFKTNLCRKGQVMEPDISVIIPSYNRAETIFQAIKSIQTQTIENIEIIVSDDASSDATLEIVKYISLHDKRIVIVESEINQGPAGAKNLGLDVATGRYIAFLDSDDLLANCDTLKKQLAIAETHGSEMVRSNYQRFRINPDNGRLHFIDDAHNNVIGAMIINTSMALMPALSLTCSSWQFLYEKKFLEKHDLRWHNHLKVRDDRAFFMSALVKCEKVSVTQDIAVLYRQHNNAVMTTKDSETLTYFIDSFKIVNKILAEYAASNKTALASFYHNHLQYLAQLPNFWKEVFLSMEENELCGYLSLISDISSSTAELMVESEKYFIEHPLPMFGILKSEYNSNRVLLLYKLILEKRFAAVRNILFSNSSPRLEQIIKNSLKLNCYDEVESLRPNQPDVNDREFYKIIPHFKHKPKLYIHVGHTKTGSTGIQNLLALNRKKLLEQGVLFPKSGMLYQGELDRTSGHHLLFKDILSDGSTSLNLLLVEMQESTFDISSIILSCENVLYNNNWREQLQKVKDTFGMFDISVAIVFRDELDWLVSMYKEAVMGGSIYYEQSFESFIADQILLGNIDYDKIFNDFVEVFGDQAVKVHILDKSNKDNLYKWFFNWLGLDPDEFTEDTFYKNEGVPSELVRISSYINKFRFPPPVRADLISKLRSIDTLASADIIFGKRLAALDISLQYYYKKNETIFKNSRKLDIEKLQSRQREFSLQNTPDSVLQHAINFLALYYNKQLEKSAEIFANNTSQNQKYLIQDTSFPSKTIRREKTSKIFSEQIVDKQPRMKLVFDKTNRVVFFEAGITHLGKANFYLTIEDDSPVVIEPDIVGNTLVWRYELQDHVFVQYKRCEGVLISCTSKEVIYNRIFQGGVDENLNVYVFSSYGVEVPSND